MLALERYKVTLKVSVMSKTHVIRVRTCKSSYANVKLLLASKLDNVPLTCISIFDGEFILWSSVNTVELWSKAVDNEVNFSETESITFDDRWGVSTSPVEFGGCWCGGWRKQTYCDALQIYLQCLSNFAERAWNKNRWFRFGRSLDRKPKRVRSVTLNEFNTYYVSMVGSATVTADCQSSYQASAEI